MTEHQNRLLPRIPHVYPFRSFTNKEMTNHDQHYRNKKELFTLLLMDRKSAHGHLGHFPVRKRLMNKSAVTIGGGE